MASCFFAAGATWGHVGRMSGLRWALASLPHVLPNVLAVCLSLLAVSAAVAILRIAGLLASALKNAIESAKTYQQKVQVVRVTTGALLAILFGRSLNEAFGKEPGSIGN